MKRLYLNERTWATLAALALGIGGFALALMTTPFWWFGAAILTAAIAVAWQAWRDRALGVVERLRQVRQIGPFYLEPASVILESIYLALIVGVGTWMLGKAALGDRPVSHDHTVHFVNAWRMREHLLPRGELLGWSHDWFAGYPIGYQYPIGAELWVNAVWRLGLGALSFNQAYAVAFWLFFLLFGYAVYRFGRAVGGPHVGAIAAMLAMTDMAEFRFGGWAYTVEYGVWPQTLSLCFALLALCRLPGLVERRSLSDISGFGVWMGLALITHPTQLLFLPMVWTATAIAAALAPQVRAAAGMLRVMLASALGFLIGAVWLIPFFSTRKEIFPMGAWWDSAYEMGRQLLELRLLPGTLGLVLALGALAVVIMLRSGKFFLLFTALIAVAIPALCNSSFIDEFHLPFASKIFYRVQYMRMVTMVKPFWFALAAFCLVGVLRYARRIRASDADRPAKETAGSRPKNYLRAAAVALLLGFLLLPISISAAWTFWTSHMDKNLQVESTRPLREERRQLVNWLRQNLPETGFYRIGIFSGDDHTLMDLSTEVDIPIYKRGFTPCSNFIFKTKSQDPSVLRAVNLRYAITKYSLYPQDFTLLKSFGPINVYSFNRWNPEPFEIIQGSGQVSVESFTDERIVLRAAQGSQGKLRLNVSYFSRWKAYRDGEPVPITKSELPAEPITTGFMTVPLAPGVYSFVFERTWLDETALPLSLLGLLLAGVLATADRRPRGLGWLSKPIADLTSRAERLSEPRHSGWRSALLAAVLLGLFGLGMALAWWQPPMGIEEVAEKAVTRVRFDFLESLNKAHVNVEYLDQNRPCQLQKDRFVCPDADGNLDIESYVASEPIDVKGYKMVRCIRARPVELAALSVIYPRVTAGEAIVGYYGIASSGRLLQTRRPVSFSVLLGGNTVYSGVTEEDSHLYWFKVPVGAPKSSRYKVQVAFSVKAPDVRQRHFCFYAQMVDF